MAVVTQTAREETVIGNKRMVTAELASVDNGDTWDCGLDKVESYHFTSETNAAVGAAESAGVFTFANTGTLVVFATVIGYE